MNNLTENVSETVARNALEVIKNDLTTKEKETAKDKIEAKKMRYKNSKLDDFMFLGKYTIVVCMLSELLILCQLGNMLYMVFSG